MSVIPQRRLAAILAADIVGYSRLVEADEAGSLAAVGDLWREVLTRSCRSIAGAWSSRWAMVPSSSSPPLSTR